MRRLRIVYKLYESVISKFFIITSVERNSTDVYIEKYRALRYRFRTCDTSAPHDHHYFQWGVGTLQAVSVFFVL